MMHFYWINIFLPILTATGSNGSTTLSGDDDFYSLSLQKNEIDSAHKDKHKKYPEDFEVRECKIV